MKNAMKILLWALMAMTCGVYGLDVMMGYSSSGPDRYADGSLVRDGECYALVFTKAGASFGGFSVDGSLTNPETDDLAAVAPTAKNGACSPVVFVLPEEYVKAHAGDVVGVYLLDTRRADGTVAGLVDGRLVRVNRFSAVPDAKVNVGAGLQACLPFAADEATGLFADAASDTKNIPRPVITKVEIVNGKFVVHVAKTVNCVTYGALGGETPDALNESVAETNRDGNEGGEIVLEMPLDRKSKFARVAGLVEIETKTGVSK